MKPALRLVHLWAALVFGLIFVVLGLSGSALAWIDELDSLLNPRLLHAPAPAGIAPGTPLRLTAAQVQAAHDALAQDARYGRPSQLMLPAHAGEVLVAWYRTPTAPAAPWQQRVSRQVMLDPATLAVTGERNWGEFGLRPALLMPTLFHLHHYLLSGAIGNTVVAVAGVALLLMTLSGIVLWWPRHTGAALRKALTVRHGGSWTRFNFQLHRAGGMYAASVLLVLAVSGVYFTMPAWIVPALGTVAHVTPPAKVVNRSAASAARIDAAAAIQAAQARFPDARIARLSLPAKAGAPYEVRLRQNAEVRQGPGATRVSIDSGDGAVLRVIDPLRARSGDTMLGWMFPLHTGEAFGLAGRTLITLAGLMPLLLLVTGLANWLKLRRRP